MDKKAGRMDKAGLRVLILAASLLLAYSLSAGASPIYVDSSAAGKLTGATWRNAFTDLHDALKAAKRGDTIHIAQGTYYTAPENGSRGASFIIGSDLVLLGGYKKGGTSRNWRRFPTILSGDIGRKNGLLTKEDSLTDISGSAFAVVYSGSAVNTTLDGLVIQGAYGVDSLSFKHPGGGLFINAWTDRDSAEFVLRNCVIKDNYSSNSSAGLWFKGRNCRIVNCTFSNNRSSRESPSSSVSAGAVFFEGFTLNISESDIHDNSGNMGGGIYCKGNYLLMSKVKMTNNSANNEGGGAIYFMGKTASLEKSVFSGNSAHNGTGGVLFFRGQVCRFINSAAYENGAAKAGGVLDFAGDSCIITGSSFSSNTAMNTGGAVLFKGSAMRLHKDTLESNSSQQGIGGAIYFEGSQFFSNSVIFRKNSSYNDGGAVNFRGVSLTSEKDEFAENSSEKSYGGAISFQGQALSVTNNKFVKNTAFKTGGGALAVRTSSFCSQLSVYEENTADSCYGGAVNFEGNVFVSKKDRFSKNSAVNGFGGAISYMGKEFDIDSSNFTGNIAGFGGAIYYDNDAGSERTQHKGIRLRKSTFISNAANHNGGALFWQGRGEADSCLFQGNRAAAGGAVYGWTADLFGKEKPAKAADSIRIARKIAANSNVFFKDSQFKDNMAERGAAMIGVGQNGDDN
ncbi:MAG: hypothetical protein LBB56_08610 [Chitinispirillales bacterium]|jgi:hypothetical protein|nr:hypothetical protein [Chitinispirillales bacterium]